MSHTDKQDNRPAIKAFLAGTAVALAMVGAALFWASKPQKQSVIPANMVTKPDIIKPVQSVILPNADAVPPNEVNSINTPESAFSARPKKVKSLSIETKAD
jgi:hypothetical protein